MRTSSSHKHRILPLPNKCGRALPVIPGLCDAASGLAGLR
jgi:hypothetical protein